VMSGTTLSAYCALDMVNYEYSALTNACTCPSGYVAYDGRLECA
jgi:hypothetical protein